MASPWRRRPLCLLLAEPPIEVAVTDLSARGARVATGTMLPLGHVVDLYHPQAGMIPATVTAHEAGALRLAFPAGAGAIGFALAAIASDMSGGA